MASRAGTKTLAVHFEAAIARNWASLQKLNQKGESDTLYPCSSSKTSRNRSQGPPIEMSFNSTYKNGAKRFSAPSNSREITK